MHLQDGMLLQWDAGKQYLASLLNKIDDHAHELSALLTTEQGGSLAQARWEIDLLTKAFAPAPDANGTK
jgi:acyl-CoA reductase-like NAD-dependent aldehyde dehydrogenase